VSGNLLVESINVFVTGICLKQKQGNGTELRSGTTQAASKCVSIIHGGHNVGIPGIYV
jgi:hypothetical protein